MKDKKNTMFLWCSFCKRDNEQVGFMIVGPAIDTCVCNECVLICERILELHKNSPCSLPNSKLFNPKCSFCGQIEEKVDYIIFGPGASICNECIENAGEIIRDPELEMNKDKK